MSARESRPPKEAAPESPAKKTEPSVPPVDVFARLREGVAPRRLAQATGWCPCVTRNPHTPDCSANVDVYDGVAERLPGDPL